MVSLDLQGVAAALQNLQRLARPQAHVLGEALHREGNDIMNKSVRLVPVDTGNLRSTAAVSRPVEEGPVVSVELRYGGHGMAPYAAIQEFGVHLNHPHGGQAHFLQQPLFEAAATFPDHIAAAIRVALPTMMRG